MNVPKKSFEKQKERLALYEKSFIMETKERELS